MTKMTKINKQDRQKVFLAGSTALGLVTGGVGGALAGYVSSELVNVYEDKLDNDKKSKNGRDKPPGFVNNWWQ